MDAIASPYRPGAREMGDPGSAFPSLPSFQGASLNLPWAGSHQAPQERRRIPGAASRLEPHQVPLGSPGGPSGPAPSTPSPSVGQSRLSPAHPGLFSSPDPLFPSLFASLLPSARRGPEGKLKCPLEQFKCIKYLPARVGSFLFLSLPLKNRQQRPPSHVIDSLLLLPSLQRPGVLSSFTLILSTWQKGTECLEPACRGPRGLSGVRAALTAPEPPPPLGLL